MTPQRKPTTLDALKRSRTLVAPGPSGNVYRIRPLNLERHALAGGLPANLRNIALQGARGIQRLFQGDDEQVSQEGEAVRGYLDGLVKQVIVEPELSEAELEFLPPVDYRWALSIAMGEEDYDGEGRRLWGREPLNRFQLFAQEHGCDPSCGSCGRVRDRVSAAVAGPS